MVCGAADSAYGRASARSLLLLAVNGHGQAGWWPRAAGYFNIGQFYIWLLGYLKVLPLDNWGE